ncbi:homeobox protein aristaless-like 3 [Lates japonicus]|uniref:Homeobox protein aristaless-like 3 n=1 Tax=Lates japonicus TaxID=270547 RepID=A0AAD3M275_LATJO|nr:homeobox protein aristaless-like 3 [Lates japonicus]
METESCLTFSSQTSRRTPENSPGLEHGGSGGSFLPCDELQKPSHLPPPPPPPPPALPHRLSLRGDLYAAAMGRFGDAAADFTHGAASANPPASPSKHSKFLDSINQDQKGTAISGKPPFYENNSEEQEACSRTTFMAFQLEAGKVFRRLTTRMCRPGTAGAEDRAHRCRKLCEGRPQEEAVVQVQLRPGVIPSLECHDHASPPQQPAGLYGHAGIPSHPPPPPPPVSPSGHQRPLAPQLPGGLRSPSAEVRTNTSLTGLWWRADESQEPGSILSLS